LVSITASALTWGNDGPADGDAVGNAAGNRDPAGSLGAPVREAAAEGLTI
jgi:hypothetical protein